MRLANRLEFHNKQHPNRMPPYTHTVDTAKYRTATPLSPGYRFLPISCLLPLTSPSPHITT